MSHKIKEALRPLLAELRPLYPALLLLGTALIAASIIWLVQTERRAAAHSAQPPPPRSRPRAPRWVLPLLLLLTALAAALRLPGMGSHCLTHPEAFSPGIPLPSGISFPRASHSLAEFLGWYLREEPHPIGYYLGMFGWVRAFGSSLTSLRLPEALIGVACIPVIYRVGSLAYDRSVGLVSAGLLALHGLHLFWSEVARMYVPACFLGLVSVWLFLELRNDPRRRGYVELGYVAALSGGLLTEWFAWLIAGVHVLWSLLHYSDPETPRAPRLLYLQSLAIVLGCAPLCQLFSALPWAGSGKVATLIDVRDFLSFGFLFELDRSSDPLRPIPLWALVIGVPLGVGLLLRGFGVKTYERPLSSAPERPAYRPLLLSALGMSIFMVGLALFVSDEFMRLVQYLAAPACIMPLVVVLLPKAATLVSPTLYVWLNQRARWLLALGLVSLFAFVPELLVFATSFAKPMMERRAVLMFVPYVLIVVAAGLCSLRQRVAVLIPVSVGVAALFISSAIFHRQIPFSPRDYATIAQEINADAQPDDLIFVTDKDWEMTPLFYYLDWRRLVATDYARVIATHAKARVWVVKFDHTATAPMVSVLSHYREAEQLSARRAHAQLYIPPEHPGQGG